jgi:hypothetical protein
MLEKNSEDTPKSQLYNKYKNLFELNKKCSSIIEESVEKIQTANKLKPEEGATAFLLAKAYKTHRAIVLLCEEGYGEDAGQLTRGLFELLVSLKYMNRNDATKRAEMYGSHELVLRLQLWNSNKTLVLSSGKVTEKDFEELETKVKELIALYGGEYERYWSCKSIYSMAAKVRLLSVYNSVYGEFSDYAHSRVTSAKGYVREEPGFGLVIDMGQKDYMIDRVLISACHFLLMVIDVSNNVFDLKLNESLVKYNQELELLMSSSAPVN